MKRTVILAVAVCLVPSLGPVTADAHSRGKRCHSVDADFKSQVTTEGCASPLGLCASGTIKHDSLLRGSMFVSINDMAQSAGMPGSEPPNVLSVSGERTLTPGRGGSLVAHVVGTAIVDESFNIQVFDELNLITGGTGRYEEAEGTLHVFGWATEPLGTFAGEISGTICY